MQRSPTPIRIRDQDLSFAFIKASGPGGQNVNKVATAVQLRFDVAGTPTLTAPAKARLRALAGKRLTAEGALLITARNHRTQEGNRREALARLEALIEQALVEPKVRRSTRPTRASKERRLTGKAERQQTKRLRGRIQWSD